MMMNCGQEKNRIKSSLYGIDLQRQGLRQKQLSLQIEELALDGTSVIHFNQRLAGQEILKVFSDHPDLLMVLGIGLTQSGKTGVMYSCIEEFTKPSPMSVPIENIYIITGLSSTEWKGQTKERIPEMLRKNVFHRPDLKTKFREGVKGKSNILIMIDEVQVACSKQQTIAKEFEEIGLLEMDYLLNHDVKIVEFSATPNGTLHDAKNWGNHSKIVPIRPGEKYTGCIDLNEQGRVYQYKNLCDSDDSINNIREIKEIMNGMTEKYHFIRTKKSIDQDKTIENFKEVFDDNVDYLIYDSETSYELNIDKKLLKKPSKHTFIFLKELARCAKTFKKEHIGVWYERFTNIVFDDVIIQGLLGRATGYDDNGESVIFSNLKSIDRYEELWKSGFSEESKWKSNSTVISKDGITRSRGTMNGALKDSGEDLVQDVVLNSNEPKIIKFQGEEGQKEVKSWYKDNMKEEFGGRGPNRRAPTKEGFYESTFGKGKNNTKSRSCEELYKFRKWCHHKGKKQHYTFHPCYRDITDKATLEWWFIYND